MLSKPWSTRLRPNKRKLSRAELLLWSPRHGSETEKWLRGHCPSSERNIKPLPNTLASPSSSSAIAHMYFDTSASKRQLAYGFRNGSRCGGRRRRRGSPVLGTPGRYRPAPPSQFEAGRSASGDECTQCREDRAQEQRTYLPDPYERSTCGVD